MLDGSAVSSSVHHPVERPAGPAAEAPIRICLLGGFRLFANGDAVEVRPGGRMEALLGNLALNTDTGVARDELLGLVWPDGETELARQSLNTLLYSLRRRLGPALPSHSAVVERSGCYRLNVADGIDVDVIEFDMAVDAAEESLRCADVRAAVDAYEHALELYAGDLAFGSHLRHLVERERLRARYLGAIARIADYHFAGGRYEDALRSALRLLDHDPCREDAHRMAMRCPDRLGASSQADRQYRLCRQILAGEFDAAPEPATEALIDLVRLDPGSV
jgi:DNA-binding SARP family transcriptional activator